MNVFSLATILRARGLTRYPTPSERWFFSKHPTVSGMAAADYRVVLNPYSKHNRLEQACVVTNEFARIAMWRFNRLRPYFLISRRQRLQFKGYGTDQDIRETIVARLITNDPSVPHPSPSQKRAADKLRVVMNDLAVRIWRR